jgi:alpha-N-arabinofuranosidase
VTVTAKVVVDAERTLGAIDGRIYGALAEHIGRVVYGGLYDPESPLADADGMRTDVLAALRDMAPGVIRWPGGNFASGYHWRDGVGPVADRPGRHDLAWDVFEPNTFGTEEFLGLCRKAGAQPYLAVNASTGSIDEAQGWVEYCTGRHPVPEVKLRQAGPHPAPHDVRIWGIGNENYGFWQHLHTDARSMAELTREWGKLLYWTDSSIEIVGVGAPSADWNWQMLTQAGRSMDFLSMHFYWTAQKSDPYHSMLASPISSERTIQGLWGMSMEAQRMLGLTRPVRIAVDEWGVWNDSGDGLREAMADLSHVMRFGLTPKAGVANSFEEFYDVKDALAVATWFHVMWRHPEKIAMAVYSMAVNTIAPLFVNEHGLVKQTTFFPLALAKQHAFGTSLDVLVLTESGVPAMVAGATGLGGHSGLLAEDSIAVIDAAGTTDGSRVHLSLVNRSKDEEVVVTLIGVSGAARRILLHHDDPFAKNTDDAPETVVLVENEVEISGSVVLPAHSHTTLIFG